MLKLLKMLKIFYKNFCACFDAMCFSAHSIKTSTRIVVNTSAATKDGTFLGHLKDCQLVKTGM
jgi:hypothetical protein